MGGQEVRVVRKAHRARVLDRRAVRGVRDDRVGGRGTRPGQRHGAERTAAPIECKSTRALCPRRPVTRTGGEQPQVPATPLTLGTPEAAHERSERRDAVRGRPGQVLAGVVYARRRVHSARKHHSDNVRANTQKRMGRWAVREPREGSSGGSESGTGVIAVSGTNPSGRRPVSDNGASALGNDRRVIKSRTIHRTRCWASSEVPRSAVHATANGYKRPTGARASGRARHEWAGARKNNRHTTVTSRGRASGGGPSRT